MKNLLIFLAIISLAFACEEPADLDLNNGDNLKLVVDGLITDDPDDQYVILSLSNNYLGADAKEFATGAEVSITNGDLTYNLVETDEGRYEFAEPMPLKDGDSVSIEILYNDKVSQASDVANRSLELLDAYAAITSYIEEQDGETGEIVERPIYSIFTSIQEPAGPGDFFLFSIVPKQLTEELTLDYMFSVNDEMVDGVLFEDFVIADGTYAAGDTVVVEAYGLSKAAFNYISSVDQAVYGQAGLFSPPPANVGTNISGDSALGFFMVGIKTSMDVVIE